MHRTALVVFILASAAAPTATAADPYELCVGTEPLPVYATASATGKAKSSLKSGTKLTVAKEQGEWGQIEYQKGTKKQTAWALLSGMTPCRDKDTPAFHPFGRPVGEVKGGVLLENSAYDCFHDPDLKVCRWVGYCYKPTGSSGQRYRGPFIADPRLPEGQRAEPDDYAGIHKGMTGFDRGHQAPDATLKAFGTTAQKETYFLSNITPQYSSLNQGLWRELEDNIRSWATASSPVCVETGPVFSSKPIKRVGKDGVAVPDAYYAIITQGAEPNVIAFLIKNEAVRHDWTEAKQFLKSVDEIEKVTGFDFLSSLPDDVETRLESKPAEEIWER